MKITCSKCGKRFNAEQHMYICPKCNHYHSQVGTDAGHSTIEKPIKKYRWETDPIELDDDENFFKRKHKETEIASLDPPTYPKSEMPDEEEPGFIETLDGLQPNGIENKIEESDFFPDISSVFKKIGLALFIIIGFVMFISNAIGGLDQWSEDSTSWDDGWDSSYSEEIIVDYGTPMKFDDFTVYIIEAHEPELEGLEADEGYKLVQVDFETESDFDYEDESMWTEVEVMYDTGNWSGSTYAYYDGDVTNITSLQNQLREDGLVAEAHYSGNYFWIFEMPEEVEDFKLRVTSFIPEKEDSWNYTIDECFVMPIEL